MSMETDSTRSRSIGSSSSKTLSMRSFLRWSATWRALPLMRSVTMVTYSWRFWNDASSMPIWTKSGRRVGRDRRTARCMMPSTWSHVRRNCRATALMWASFSQPITIASISAVKLDLRSVHGTSVWTTPCSSCSSHVTLGTSASRIVLNWQVSRWRQVRRRAS